MTRWGISSDTLPDPQTRERRVINVDADTAEVAGRLLGNILENTKGLEKKSRRSYDTLLEDVSRNISLLEKLVPQIIDSQRELYHIKREEVGDGERELVMELLREVSNNDSPLGRTACFLRDLRMTVIFCIAVVCTLGIHPRNKMR